MENSQYVPKITLSPLNLSENDVSVSNYIVSWAEYRVSYHENSVSLQPYRWLAGTWLGLGDKLILSINLNV